MKLQTDILLLLYNHTITYLDEETARKRYEHQTLNKKSNYILVLREFAGPKLTCKTIVDPTGEKILEAISNALKEKQLFMLGSKGIRQWPMNLCTSPMMKYKITLSVDYNY